MTNHIVILAAGLGTRMRPLTGRLPKALVPFGPSTLIGHNLQHLNKLRSEFQFDVTIVAGYEGAQVITEINRRWPWANVIVNANYAATNNIESLRLGSELVGVTDHLIWFNGDCVYDADVFRLIFESEESMIAIDSSCPHNRESMKVLSKNGYVSKISKQLGPGEQIFVSIDLYRLSNELHAQFATLLSTYRKQGRLDVWAEMALNEFISECGGQIRPLDIAGLRWAEIDNLDDLQKAQRQFGFSVPGTPSELPARVES